MRLNKILESLVLISILAYQRYISPVISNKIKCRFYPTCSEYAKQAIKKFGLLKGTIKTVKRYIRCNPYNLESCIDYP